MNSISIIGSGKVGGETGECLEKLGHKVIYCDINPNTISELSRQGKSVSDDVAQTVSKTDVSFVCVPTPSDNGINLTYVVDAVKKITEGLRNSKHWHLVVIKSTVIPLTTEKVVLPILQSSGKEFGLCMNPEFLTEIAKSWTQDFNYHRGMRNTERIVIGELDKKSGDVLSDIYLPLHIPIFRTDLKTAEMCKYAANLMLATKISYWNEMFLVCQKLEIDSRLVGKITAMDKRIGFYGTINGMAAGGRCIPKDMEAYNKFIEKELFFKNTLLSKVKDINKFMAEKYGVRE